MSIKFVKIWEGVAEVQIEAITTGIPIYFSKHDFLSQGFV